MKKLTGLILILAVLILGGYYGMGFLTERTIKRNIAVINQTNGLLAQVEHYDRGWFSSHADIKWRLHVAERIVTDDNGNTQTIAAQDHELITPITICHGPVIYCHHTLKFGMGYAESTIALPEQYYKQFDEQFASDSIKPQFDISIFINYWLKSTIELAIPEFKLVGKDGSGTVTWEGFKTSMNLSNSKEQMDGQIVINGINFFKDNIKAELDKVTAHYNMHEAKNGLYLGRVHFELPAFTVMEKTETLLGVKKLTLVSDSDIDDNLFHTQFTLAVDSVLADKKTYGPGEFEIALRNLDADVLAQINQQSNQMQNGTDEERQQAMIAMLPELPKLFNKGAELEIKKCQFKFPEGLVDGNLLLTIPKNDSANPFELMQKVQGHAQLKAPIVLIKQLLQQSILQQLSKQPEMQQALMQQLNTANTPALTNQQLAVMQAEKQVNTMLQKGLLVASGTDYVIELSLLQGQLTINGHSFDPSMLMF
ncbi:MAG: hypothetical protein CK426_07095 [Legionella sp.]|nr:MAG: hypothetical protein CK423_04315 [Legionella sp.]PJD97988.1 MAG: hypothetical protein CK426_07095 [Legionella sp.]